MEGRLHMFRGRGCSCEGVDALCSLPPALVLQGQFLPSSCTGDNRAHVLVKGFQIKELSSQFHTCNSEKNTYHLQILSTTGKMPFACELSYHPQRQRITSSHYL